MAYSKHAFNCSKCPGKGGDGGCPAWWETVHENVQTGETKVVKGCAWEQLPLYLIEVIKASNRPAAAVESTRNEIVRGFEEVARIMAVSSTSIRRMTGDDIHELKRITKNGADS